MKIKPLRVELQLAQDAAKRSAGYCVKNDQSPVGTARFSRTTSVVPIKRLFVMRAGF